jgi:hypothetical protein
VLATGGVEPEWTTSDSETVADAQDMHDCDCTYPDTVVNFEDAVFDIGLLATWSQQGRNPYNQLQRVTRDNEMISPTQSVPEVASG